jgi:hypothetical protein
MELLYYIFLRQNRPFTTIRHLDIGKSLAEIIVGR